MMATMSAFVAGMGMRGMSVSGAIFFHFRRSAQSSFQDSVVTERAALRGADGRNHLHGYRQHRRDGDQQPCEPSRHGKSL